MAGRALNIVASSSGHAILHDTGDDLRLTPREQEVVELLACGFSHKRVAARLGISPSSVAVYTHQIAARLAGDGHPSIKVVVWYLSRAMNGESKTS